MDLGLGLRQGYNNVVVSLGINLLSYDPEEFLKVMVLS